MFKSIYRLFSSVLFVTLCLSLLSCNSSHIDEPAGESLITLKVILPQDEECDVDSPASRSGSSVPGTGDEAKITGLKFFIFNGTSLEQYKGITIAGDGTSTDPMWDPVSKTLRITVTPGNKQIYCLANWADNTAAGMPVIDDNTVTTIAGLTNQVRNHNTSLTLSNPPVMTGYLQKNLQGDETGLSIELKRQIARVELSFKLSDVLSTIGTSNIVITGVKFLKLPSASYVFPKSPTTSPSGITTWGQTTFTGATSAALTGTATAYPTLYYIPEYTPSAANATTMVISATYNGTPTYYSVVLNPMESPDQGMYNHVAYAIERNHSYRYTITIEGVGESTVPTRSVGSGSANITYNLEIK